MVGLQYCQTVLSANRPGQSYGVAKSVHLTVKYNRFVLLVCTLVAKCIKIAMYMEFGFFCPYFALMAMWMVFYSYSRSILAILAVDLLYSLGYLGCRVCFRVWGGGVEALKLIYQILNPKHAQYPLIKLSNWYIFRISLSLPLKIYILIEHVMLLTPWERYYVENLKNERAATGRVKAVNIRLLIWWKICICQRWPCFLISSYFSPKWLKTLFIQFPLLEIGNIW